MWFIRGMRLLLLLVSFSKCTSVTRPKKPLHIGIFVSLKFNQHIKGWNSFGVYPALKMALEEVNNHTEILHDYTVAARWKDEQCGSGVVVQGLIELLKREEPVVAILGPGCSMATSHIAQVLKFWNIVELGFAASSPEFSDSKRFPNYFRVNPSENLYNHAVKALLDKFNWKEISILKSDGSYFGEVAEHLIHILNNYTNAKSVLVRSFRHLGNIGQHIQFLKENDARIIVLLAYESEARDVFCEAYRNGFHGDNIQWILRGWYSKNWWCTMHVKCSSDEIITGMGYYLALNEVSLRDGNINTTYGMGPYEFMTSYSSRAGNWTDETFGAYAYDAVWVMAEALHKTEQILVRMNESLANFNYSRKDIAELVKQQLMNNGMIGVTGNIIFDENGSRDTDVWVEQFQERTHGKITMCSDPREYRVGIFFSHNKTIMINENLITWKGGKIPLDREQITIKELMQSRYLVHITFATCSFGVALAILFLSVNVGYRKNEIIKMSCPLLNNLIIIGAVSCYVYVGLSNIDEHSTALGTRSSMCKVRLALLSCGFSLSFGTMFVKTWRLYKIFTNNRLKKKVGRLSNKYLVLAVACMLFFDIMYILLWDLFYNIHSISMEIPSKVSPTIKYHFYNCSSKLYQTWIVGLVFYKAILLIFGSFLAWQTRGISFAGINDSKYIGLSVYNVVIVSIILAPLQYLVPKERVNEYYGVLSFGILYCTTSVLLLIFIPKIIRLHRSSKTPLSAKILI